MARDINRLTREIEFCSERDINLEFTDTGSMVMVPDLVLPKGKYNKYMTSCIIMIPDNYGYGVKLGEFYLESSLRFKSGNKIPRHYDTMKKINHLVKNEFAFLGSIPEFSYFCIHPEGDLTIDEFLEQVFFFLTNAGKVGFK